MDSWMWVGIGAAAGMVLLGLLLETKKVGEVVVNTVVALLLVAGIVLGVVSLQQDADDTSCTAPASSSTEKANASKEEARAALTQAQAELRRARREADGSSTGAAPRQLRKAERAVDKARRELDRWRPATLTVADTANTAFKLGSDRNTGTRSIGFSADRRILGPTRLDVAVSSFGRADVGQELRKGDLVAWAELKPGRQAGTIYLCVPPSVRLSVPSGQFTGELTLGPGRVERLAVPVTVSLRNPHFTTVVLASLATVWVASWYVFFLRRDALPDLILLGKARDANKATAATQLDRASRVLRWPFGFWHGYWRWVSGPSGAITVVAGLAAAVTAFSTAYLGSDTWAGTFGDWFALCGAIATAFVAGGTAGKLTQLTPPDPKKPPE